MGRGCSTAALRKVVYSAAPPPRGAASMVRDRWCEQEQVLGDDRGDRGGDRVCDRRPGRRRYGRAVVAVARGRRGRAGRRPAVPPGMDRSRLGVDRRAARPGPCIAGGPRRPDLHGIRRRASLEAIRHLPHAGRRQGSLEPRDFRADRSASRAKQFRVGVGRGWRGGRVLDVGRRRRTSRGGLHARRRAEVACRSRDVSG